MTKAITLRDCPFCAHKNRSGPDDEYDGICLTTEGVIAEGVEYVNAFMVRCMQCGGQGPSADDKDYAVNSWNGMEVAHDSKGEPHLIPIGTEYDDQDHE